MRLEDFDNDEDKVIQDSLKQKTWNRSSYMVSSKIFWGSEDGKPNQKGLSRKHIHEASVKSLSGKPKTTRGCTTNIGPRLGSSFQGGYFTGYAS